MSCAIYGQVEHCECVVGWVVQSSIIWLVKASSDPDQTMHVAEGLTLTTSVLIGSGVQLYVISLC